MENKSNLPPELEQYFLLCTREYERMERENSWPWDDKDENEVPLE